LNENFEAAALAAKTGDQRPSCSATNDKPNFVPPPPSILFHLAEAAAQGSASAALASIENHSLNQLLHVTRPQQLTTIHNN